MTASLEPGAPPLSGTIPLSVPMLAGNEARYLAECIASGWVSSVGPWVERFEREIAAFVGVPHAVATTSGTAALHLALVVAGLQPDEEVLVSNLTFIASANPVRYAGAWPVFIGSEPDYWQISPDNVRDFLQNECTQRDGAAWNRSSGRRVRALVVVHVLGHPVDLAPLAALAEDYNLVLIEDCAEAIGAEYRETRVGRSGLAVFSFNGNKVMTCGGGGMLVTDRLDWAARARHLSTQAKSDPREYIHDEVGYNYRLTSLQAAVGCAQLEQLGKFLARKREIAARYSEALATVPGIEAPPEASWARSTFWLSTVLIDEAKFGCDSRALMRRLEAAGIQTRPLWQPLHRSPALRGCQAFRCEGDDRLAAEALSLPSSPGLLPGEQERVITAILAAR